MPTVDMPVLRRLILGLAGVVAVALAGAFVVGRPWWAAVPWCLGALALTWRAPGMAVATFAAMLPFVGNWHNRQFYLIAPGLEIPLLAVGGVALLRGGEPASRLERAFLALLGIAGVSAWSQLPAGAWPHLFDPALVVAYMADLGQRDAFFPLRAWLTLAEMALVYHLARTRWQAAHETLWAGALVIGAIPPLLVAGVQYAGDTSPAWAGINRAFATFTGPNEFADYLLLVLPVAAALAVETTGIARHALRALTVACALALVASHSRGAWLGALVAGIWTLWPRRRRILGLAAGVLAAAGGALLALAPYLDHVRWNQWTGGRLYLWQSAVHMAAAHPLTGVGMGRFFALEGAFAPRWLIPRAWHEHAHSLYLQVGAELGLIGLSALAVVLWTLRTPLRQARSPLEKGLAAGLIAILVHQSVDYTLQVVPLALLVGLAAGWLVAATSCAAATADAGPGPDRPEGSCRLHPGDDARP
jgi:O-antigen ligase